MNRKVLVVDEVNIKLDGFAYDELKQLIEKSKIADPKAFSTPSFKIGAWDGKHAFISDSGYSYVYLLDDISQWMTEIGINPDSIELLDYRKDRFVYAPEAVTSEFLSDYGYTLRYYQVEAVNAVFEAEKGIVYAATGCHERGTKILMASGQTKSVEDIVYGDQVMGPDSKPRNVTDVHSGTDEMFRIVPNSGESFVVNGNHVLSLYRTNDGRKYAGTIDNITVNDWRKKGDTYKHLYKLYRTPIDFPVNSNELPIDPYLLGVLIGDGYLKEHIAITNPNKEIIEAITPLVDKEGGKINKLKTGNRCDRYSLVCKSGRINTIHRKIKKMGLNCTAHHKFLPDDYKTASRENRLKLLAGLMDTDGCLGGSGYDYISASKQLVEDIAFIARSLGFAAYPKECTKKWQEGEGTYYRVFIGGDVYHIPCQLPYKKASYTYHKKNVLLDGFKVEYVGLGVYYGFECDGDHLYVMSDFTVTHNSGKTLCCAALCKSYEKGNLTTLTVVPSDKLLNDTHKLYEKIGLNSGRFKGKDKSKVASESTHIVTTWQTLNNNFDYLLNIDVLIYDETHIMGDAIFELLSNKMVNIPVRIGLTASPPFKNKYKWTKIRCALGGDIIYTIKPKELIDEGYITTLDVAMHPIQHLNFDWFSEWPVEQDYLNTNKARLSAIADFIQSIHKENTLILSHAQVAEALSILLGIDYIDKDVNTETREYYFNKFAEQSDYILAGSWGTSATGISVDDIFNLVLVDAQKDVTRITQGIGRGLRKDTKNVNHLKVYDLYSDSRYSAAHAKRRKSQYKELEYPYSVKQPIIIS